MRKYYTRPCNFYYGNYANNLVKIKKALPLAGNNNISFDKLEIFQRKKKEVIKSSVYSIQDVKKLNKEIKKYSRTRFTKNNMQEKNNISI